MHSIREATPEDVRSLPAIERAAAGMFRQSHYPHMADGSLAIETVHPIHNRVWVVVDDEVLAGFVMTRRTGHELYIQEIDVHPAHARRGLGRMLIEHVASLARGEGLKALTLITFSDVSWNGPYYARLGFTQVDLEALTPGLRAMRKAEEEAGLPMTRRICMRLLL